MFMPLSHKSSRAEKGLFSEAYYESYYIVIADEARDIHINDLSDLGAYKVGVVEGAALENVLRSALPEAHVVPLNDQDNRSIYQAVLDRKVEVLVDSRSLFKEELYIHYVFNLEPISTFPGHPPAYRFSFSGSETHRKLIGLFNRYLEHIDTYDSVAAHEVGERKLIEKYVKQRSIRQL